MHRRTLLASIPALASSTAVAGCLGGTDEEVRSTPTVSLEVEVLQSFADDHPARVRLTFTNRADDLLLLSPGTMQGIPGPLTAISGSRRDDGRELLVFYRGGDVEQYALCAGEDRSPIPDEPVDGCWRPPCTDGLEIISAHGPLELAPDETITGEYTVLDGFDDGCLRPGTYEFEDSTAIGPAVPMQAVGVL